MNFLSLFSGIEGASEAWLPLGWTCVGVSEIDPYCNAVLDHWYPHVPNLGSVTDITAADLKKLGRVDLLVAGSPCQDLSRAGAGKGLKGSRSGLFYEQIRIFKEAKKHCEDTRWMLWENVPGALRSNGGDDFTAVVNAMAGCNLSTPRNGWGTEGVALGEHGLLEWAVLDAQWFGLAQRRRRLLAILDTGDWRRRKPILLEPESLRGDSPPPRREESESSGDSGEGSTARWWNGDPVSQTLDAVLNKKQCLPEKNRFPVVEVPAWVPCDMCDDYICVIHGEHAHDCGCPPVEEWGDCFPYENGALRYLLPVEAERLQGFEDGHTLVPYTYGKPAADGPRYSSLGNSFPVPMIRWVGQKIEEAINENT